MPIKSLVIQATSRDVEDGYPQLEQLVASRVRFYEGPMFSTNAVGLYDAFLDGLPDERRQHYNCHTCRRFVDNYGGLVTINENGDASPVVIGGGNEDECPKMFRDAVWNVHNVVSRAKVTGVFLSSDASWGTSEAGGWSHLSAVNPKRFTGKVKSAEQEMAEKVQDYQMLKRGLADYSVDVVREAVRVLEADVLDRSEKTLGNAKWLLSLHESVKDLRGPRSDNIVWLSVATAPPGWCHVRSTMIATLLDDVAAGKSYDEVSRRWSAKMHPLQYQRPTMAPREGAIDQAEKLFAKMGCEASLGRRFARIEEVIPHAIWLPTDAAKREEKIGGVFDHLRASSKTVKPLDLPAVKMTWLRFRDELLKDAVKVEVNLPSVGAYYGMVTAADPTAPNLLQWDNSFSWYFYHGGSHVSDWSLVSGWSDVTAVLPAPPHWGDNDKMTHHVQMAMLVLPAAKDLRHESGGGLFPECLRSEYHGVRSVLERHVATANIEGRDEGTANGLVIQQVETYSSVMLRITRVDGTTATVLIDRWQ